ncbi:MAG TPA: hypothetical protein VMC84_08630 [Methanocella sp.]|uniref:hypothetical protein n=1 Tax=Methanocella sp. TaxID=2052833 RepID=UPI002C80CA4C|nr:hypothetical protein [Methanocella sp.]HTY91226.1 hypothetical protein [Methanocella sp.]
MPADTDAYVGRLITYLSGQNDFVSAGDVLRDRLSGLHSEDEIEPALEAAAPFLETKEDDKKGTMYRLARNFDGYRAVFTAGRKSGMDVYNFLYSNYSNALVNGEFIKEALNRILQLPYFVEMEAKYAPGNRPGDAVVLMLSQSPGFDALAVMFRISPSVATYLLFPEVLSKYELTHLKVTLDLAFASDMLKRVPPATSVVIKYEVTAQGMLNLETRGGTGIP